jgi:malonyl CoA-acyl carrier protein transacylase
MPNKHISTPAQVFGGDLTSDISRITLSQALADAAITQNGYVFIDGDGIEIILTYVDIQTRATAIASGLKRAGINIGDHVIFQFDHGKNFFIALWACFLGGFVPVPISVPPFFVKENAVVKRIANVWHMLDKPVVLTSINLSSSLKQLGDELGLDGFRCIDIDSLELSLPIEPLPGLQSDSPAILLLTSGSTGIPKGALLTHANLIAMAMGTIQMNHFTSADVALNWMALDHVGSISFLGVMPVVLKCRQIHVASGLILSNPLQWLELIQKYHVSISWAPNFAFSLINQQEKILEQSNYDLTSMRFLVNAGEQVAAKTVRQFLHLLSRHGLPADALRPAFGMSETCSGITWSAGLTVDQLIDTQHYVHLGRPIPGAWLRITDEDNQVLPEQDIGRLQLKGNSVTAGYYKNSMANASAFTADGWFITGDLGYLEKGDLVITGREKQDIIINGINYAAHEIEACVEELAEVEVSYTAAFMVVDDNSQVEQLVVVFNPADGVTDEEYPSVVAKIRGHISKNISINPTFIIPLPENKIPKTSIGKIQHSQLKQEFKNGAYTALIDQVRTRVSANEQPDGEIECQIANVWKSYLGLPDISRNDNFFELGGHSILLIQVHSRLKAIFENLTLVDLFKFPNISSLARYLRNGQDGVDATHIGKKRANARIEKRKADNQDIAVIGMACRFPGANTIDEFWKNLQDGVESISFFTDEEMLESGIDRSVWSNPNYVKASPIIDNAEYFDAGFFGYTDKEAELMDPQQRIFLECCWELFENASYNPLTYDGSVGLYAGASMNTYLLNNIAPNRHRLDSQDNLKVTTLDSMGGFQMMVANDKDYLATRTSYKLNLTGPSINVQTACSTGLVVIHEACKSLIAGESDMAIAGCSSLQSPQKAGHLFQEGMLVTPDGHCRAFDKSAKGTIFGSGVGAVLLKPLAKALEDKDFIYAVIKGTAVNNDGGDKMGFLAPSETGQSQVAAEAIGVAGIEPESISYMEAHGTGTEMGDPIEFLSLAKALGFSEQKNYCALGAVKTNIGHLQISSGIAGFIKACLAVHHKKIPPTLHFTEANPAIDLPNSPFYINTEPREWNPATGKRRAGINSLGIGGTNAHVVIEEAPVVDAAAHHVERPLQLYTLSAKNQGSLDQSISNIKQWIADEKNSRFDLHDICFSANTGRVHFDKRIAVVAKDSNEFNNALVFQESEARKDRAKIAFLFTGQGAQYYQMGKSLYESQPRFRETLDRCDAILSGLLGFSLIDFIFSDDINSRKIHQTEFAQPALFSIEYALADLWLHWGVKPTAVAGHSLGEYVAACIAGVMDLESALTMVFHRARLMSGAPGDGAMAMVFATEKAVQTILEEGTGEISIASVNGPGYVVISGERSALDNVLELIHQADIATTPLKVSHAFHSPLMQPVLESYREILTGIEFKRPGIAIVSNVTGLIIDEEIQTVDYWLQHIIKPVRFSDSMETLFNQGCNTFVEIGPKPILIGMAKGLVNQDAGQQKILWLASLAENVPSWEIMLSTLATLYINGINIDWVNFDEGYVRNRIPLPTYSFNRKKYWLAAPTQTTNENIHPTSTVAMASRGNASNDQWSTSAANHHSEKISHPLLDQIYHSPLIDNIYASAVFSHQKIPLLKDHVVFKQVVVSGACFTSMVLGAVASVASRNSAVLLKDICFLRTLVVQPAQETTVQLTIQGNDIANKGDAATRFYIDSLVRGNEGQGGVSQRHVEGIIETANAHVSKGQYRNVFELARTECLKNIAPRDFYQQQRDNHINLGASYQWLESLSVGDRQAVATIVPPVSVLSELGRGVESYIHPGLIDSCYALILAAFNNSSLNGSVDTCYIPFFIEEFSYFAPGLMPARFLASAKIVSTESDAGNIRGDIQLMDEAGNIIINIKGLEARPANKQDLRTAADSEQLPFYSIDWINSSIGKNNIVPISMHKTWILFADAGGVAAVLATLLEQKGAQVYLFYAEGSGRETNDHCIEVNPENNHVLKNKLADLLAKHPLAAIVNFWALDINPVLVDTQAIARARTILNGSVLGSVQALANHNHGDSYLGLVLVTRGAQCAIPGQSPTPASVLQANLLGMGKSLRLEHPEFNCRNIDLSPRTLLDPASDADQLLLELLNGIDNEVAYQASNTRAGDRYVARLLPSASQFTSPIEPITFSAHETCLITGALGNIAVQLRSWLITKGVRHFVLIGQRELTEQQINDFNQLRQQDIAIEYIQSNFSDPARLFSDLDKCLAKMPVLSGVFHTAGSLSDGMLAQQEWEGFERPMRVKMEGAWLLHEYCQSQSLRFFVLFSSAASVLGNKGQTNYAAANSFMDSLAHYRQSQNLVATSISWGPWAEGGMATRSELIRTHLQQQGIQAIDTQVSLSLLEQVLLSKRAHLCVLECDWNIYDKTCKASGISLSLLRDLVDLDQQEDSRENSAPATIDHEFLLSLNNIAAADREKLLKGFVERCVLKVISLGETTSIHHERSLTEQGIDSLSAVELRNLLCKGVDKKFPVGIVFQHSTVNAMASFLMSELFPVVLTPSPTKNAQEDTSDGLDNLSFAELQALIGDELDLEAIGGA